MPVSQSQVGKWKACRAEQARNDMVEPYLPFVGDLFLAGLQRHSDEIQTAILSDIIEDRMASGQLLRFAKEES